MGGQVPRPGSFPEHDEAECHQQPVAEQIRLICTAYAALWQPKRAKRQEFESVIWKSSFAELSTRPRGQIRHAKAIIIYAANELDAEELQYALKRSSGIVAE